MLREPPIAYISGSYILRSYAMTGVEIVDIVDIAKQ